MYSIHANKSLTLHWVNVTQKATQDWRMNIVDHLRAKESDISIMTWLRAKKSKKKGGQK